MQTIAIASLTGVLVGASAGIFAASDANPMATDNPVAMCKAPVLSTSGITNRTEVGAGIRVPMAERAVSSASVGAANAPRRMLHKPAPKDPDPTLRKWPDGCNPYDCNSMDCDPCSISLSSCQNQCDCQVDHYSSTWCWSCPSTFGGWATRMDVTYYGRPDGGGLCNVFCTSATFMICQG